MRRRVRLPVEIPYKTALPRSRRFCVGSAQGRQVEVRCGWQLKLATSFDRQGSFSHRRITVSQVGAPSIVPDVFPTCEAEWQCLDGSAGSQWLDCRLGCDTAERSLASLLQRQRSASHHAFLAVMIVVSLTDRFETAAPLVPLECEMTQQDPSFTSRIMKHCSRGIHRRNRCYCVDGQPALRMSASGLHSEVGAPHSLAGRRQAPPQDMSESKFQACFRD